MQDDGCRVMDAILWMQDDGYKMMDARRWMQDVGCSKCFTKYGYKNELKHGIVDEFDP